MVILFLKTRLNEEIARIIKNKYWTFASIPVIAGAVGYVTNFVGVQMLFYPIEYKGLQYRRNLEQPYGYMLAGWQGVVPCKRVTMANSMVDVVSFMREYDSFLIATTFYPLLLFKKIYIDSVETVEY